MIIYDSISNTTQRDIAKLKKTVLNLGTRFLRLEIRDVAEKSGLNIKKVEDGISEMIKNNEIYANISKETKVIYANISKETKVIEFNQDANLEEMDNLLEMYEQWEQKSVKKK